MYRQILLVLLVLVTLGGCASRQAAEQQAANQNQQQSQEYNDPRDSIEGFNRAMWDFNYDVLDEYLLRPLTVFYVDYMPGFARKGLHNMALNLEEPANFVNNLLQGKLGESLVSVGRFAVNSTIGLLGAIDVASELGLEREEEDFGQTLGVYGVGTGTYLMLPARGPTDLRSTAGNLVDNAYFPLVDLNFYVGFLRLGIKALESRAQLMEQERMLAQSLDPYAFVKNAYFQNLEFKVKDGKVEAENNEELEDDFSSFEDALDGIEDID